MKLCPALTPLQKEELESYLRKTSDVLEYKRILTVLLLNKKKPPDEISEATGYSRSQSFRLRLLYLKLGINSLKNKRKGKPKELLTEKQLKEVENLLITQSPTDFGYQNKFWSTSVLSEIIWKTYQVKYKSKTSYYLIFKRIKFTYHKPGRVFEKRSEKEVAAWRRKAKRSIAKIWDNPDWIILAADEMLLSTATTFQKIWLPQGKYPKLEVANTRKNKSIYGFLNVKTGKEHAFSSDKQNMFVTARMLSKIRAIYPKRKNKGNKLKGKNILLLWDNPGWHRGSMVMEYLKKDGKIKVLYFPRYSPEENPQEHVWKEGRDKVTNNKFIGNLDNITEDFVTYLNTHYFTYKLLNYSPIS